MTQEVTQPITQPMTQEIAKVYNHHPEFAGVIPDGAKLSKLATGLSWAEGPTWLTKRQCLIFSDVRQNRTWRWSHAEGLASEMFPSHHQNGHCSDAAGRLIACSHGERALLRQEDDGAWVILADQWQGKRLNSPNDVALAPDGSLWFSDPTYGIDKPEEGYGGQQELAGRYVFRLAPDGSLSCPITERHKPNGLAFLDEQRLLLADTGDGCTYLYRVDGEQATLERELMRLPIGKTDGLRVDAQRRIWSSGGDGVYVFDEWGEMLGHIAVPEVVSNLCFGGENGDELFITASSSLYHLKTNAKGL